MSPIAHALSEIRFGIPAQVLQYAFVLNRRHQPRVPISLDSVIRETVITKRVLPDCNITGGVHLIINISNAQYTSTNDGFRVYNLSKTLTGGRDITAAIAVGNNTYVDSVQNGVSGSSLSSNLQALYNANVGGAGLYTPEVRLIGGNTILIEDDITRFSSDLHLYCTVANDAEMSNLPVRSYDSFSKLVVLAVKSHIYNSCRVRMGSGVLSGGVELSQMREVIDEYADAEELYKEYLRTGWTRKSLLNDKTARKKHIRLITPR